MGNNKRFILALVLCSFISVAWLCNNKTEIIPITNFGTSSADVVPGPVPANLTFNMPQGLVTDHNGNIWMADTGNNRLIIFNAQLNTIIQVFGKLGSKLGEFNMPFRLAIHPDKNWVYVTDMNNNRVQILEYDNNYAITAIKKFGKPGLGDGEFNGPNAIAVTKVNNKVSVVVSDEFAGGETVGRIMIFNEKGHFLNKINAITHQGESYSLKWPQGISIDSSGNIYIGDVGYARVIRCDLNGNGVPFYNGSPILPLPNPGFLLYPRGLKVVRDKLYIQDNGTSAASVFSLDGHFISLLMRNGSYVFYGPIEVTASTLSENAIIITENTYPRVSALDVTAPYAAQTLATAGGFRWGTAQFSYVTSVKMDIDNDLYVVDAMNYRIQKWAKIDDSNYEFKSNFYLPYFASGIGYLKDEDKFIVTSPLECKFYIYDKDSSFLSKKAFGVAGSAADQLLYPRGIHIKDNLIYLADTGNNRISVWSYDPATGDATHQFNIGQGDFNYPTSIAVGSNGNVYVTDMNNDRVMVYSGTGAFQFSFGQSGYEEYNFFLPIGLNIANDVVYVTDLVSRSIKGFNLDGEYLDIYYRNFGCTLGGMWFSFVPEIVDNRMMYIPDGTLNRVNVFEIAAADYATPGNGNKHGALANNSANKKSVTATYRNHQQNVMNEYAKISQDADFIKCQNDLKKISDELLQLIQNNSSEATINQKKLEYQELIKNLRTKMLDKINPVF